MNVDSNPYLSWLCCLHELMSEVEAHSLLEVEQRLAADRDAALPPFTAYPVTLQQPYYDFACDMFVTTVGCWSEAPLRDYARRYVDALVAEEGADEPLLRMIAEAVLAYFCVTAEPLPACEAARGEIPAPWRPEAAALWALLSRDMQRLPTAGEGSAAIPPVGVGTGAPALPRLVPGAADGREGVTTYLSWLVALQSIMGVAALVGSEQAIRRELADPTAAGRAFACCPLTLRQPYLRFGVSLLELAVAPRVTEQTWQRYGQRYIRGAAAGGKTNTALLRMIMTVIGARFVHEHGSGFALELGRLEIPVGYRPRAVRLFRFLSRRDFMLRNIERSLREPPPPRPTAEVLPGPWAGAGKS